MLRSRLHFLFHAMIRLSLLVIAEAVANGSNAVNRSMFGLELEGKSACRCKTETPPGNAVQVNFVSAAIVD